MTQPTETAREAVERNAQALASGQIATVMADITPQALGQLMHLSARAGQMSPGQMPADATYVIEERGPDDIGEVFDVRFSSTAGSVALRTTWAAVAGRWKVASVELLDANVPDLPTSD